MFKSIPSNERKQLGFKEEALKAFSFLITNYGFRCVQSEETIVKYQSDIVFVNIYHGRLSYQLGFEVGLVKDKDRFFSLKEIMEIKDAANEAKYTFYQASTKERVKKYISKLAELVKRYAEDVLIGDNLVFKRLQKHVEHRSTEYLKEIKLNRIREEAEKAWRKKEYEKLVRLYESIKEDLSLTESKKLDYSKKKCSKRFESP